MADVCSGCGKKFSGFNKVDRCTDYAGKLINTHPEVFSFGTETLCENCIRTGIKPIYDLALQEFKAARKEKEAAIDGIAAMPLMTTPVPVAWDAEILGIASGHSVIGTGPISSIASAFTDFFGKESMAYLEKIRTAEKSAMLGARIQAVEMGGTALCGCTLTVSEATSGHGMIMVSFVGTAIKVKLDDALNAHISRYIEANKNFTVLQEKINILMDAINTL